MQIVQYRKIHFLIVGLLILISLVSLLFWRLKFSIDFTGGTLMEMEFLENRPSSQEIREKLNDLNLGQISQQTSQEKAVILRFKDIDEATHQQILEKIGRDKIIEKRFESVGPLIGAELKKKSLLAIFISLVGIILYIAWAFRRVSRPVNSWQYGLISIFIIFFNILIVCGLFSFLGRFRGVEIDLTFIAAILTILGYSVNSSIIVFDRLRENLIKTNWDSFEETINLSVNQAFAACLNTSITTFLPLLAIFFFGGVTIRYFALALIAGILIGLYSSVFIAGPLAMIWHRRRNRE